MTAAGLEPATCCSGNSRSIQLSYAAPPGAAWAATGVSNMGQDRRVYTAAASCRNWPQAAAMSRPRLARMWTLTPADRRTC